MKKQGNAMGISLILVVFILLCLITFGTLSYMLADIDNDLSISAAENIIEFYEGDMEAQAQLQYIDEVLQEVYNVSDQEDYIDNISYAIDDMENVTLDVSTEGNYLIFYTEISEKEVLVSTLEILYPVESNYYRIESWVLETR